LFFTVEVREITRVEVSLKLIFPANNTPRELISWEKVIRPQKPARQVSRYFNILFNGGRKR
jgi:hypothetical protein